MTVSDLTRWLEAFAPLSLAADWDNVGLLLGESTAPVERVMTCLTVTPAVVAEAVAKHVNLIVSHHPVLFRGTKKLTDRNEEGKLLLPLLKHGIAVYSPHTALDNCVGGINDHLATLLNLENVRPLRAKDSRFCKLVVYVPEADLNKVSDAVFAAGGGGIGDYEQCGFRTLGTGTFFPKAGANPTIGKVGTREEVSEFRWETLVPESRIGAAVAAMRAAHSYEEPAFDVIPLRPLPGAVGEGRLGTLKVPATLAELASQLKIALAADVLQTVGDRMKSIRTIGIACGAAGEFLKDAIRENCDAFLTGEVRFHDCLAAEAADIALLLPGHYASERPAVEMLAVTLNQAFPSLQIWASIAEQDPLKTA